MSYLITYEIWNNDINGARRVRVGTVAISVALPAQAQDILRALQEAVYHAPGEAFAVKKILPF